MFHIKQLEVVHWDYWRRFVLPVDAQIITIVGPNGSGKTTLLDALRTLFALRCSGKRDFRRYVRRSNKGFAWIRALVANKPGASGKRPFFPCLSDEVTLACRIRRAGGDWTRDYTIADGDLAIEALEQANDWSGLRDYQHRLAFGGLTPAIAKVLSLEQGDTDKLCEYSPKALLELVFDVFGDKEVLDNYQAAREEQRNAERELADLGLDLDRLRAQAEAKRLEADRYREWKQLADEAQALASEIIPRLEVAELQRQTELERAALARSQTERLGAHERQRATQTRLESLARELGVARDALTLARQQDAAAEQTHLATHDRLRDIEKLLAERDALRQRLAREHGQDALTLEAEFEAAEAERQALRGQERQLSAEFEELAQQLRNNRDRSGPPTEPEVARFRTLLQDSGIPHQGLAEVVEITDRHWQIAVEAVLRPFRHIILLEREADRFSAWALGERERFRHFIVPEREPAPAPRRDSLAEVVRFSGPVPRWLPDLLNRIIRVEDSDTARGLPREAEWITPDAYHRERRGARHMGRPGDFHFGELGRKTRLENLATRIAEVDRKLQTLHPRLDAANQQVTALRERLLGLQSAQLLAAKAAQYKEAEAGLTAARASQTAAIAARTEAKGEVDTCNERLRGIEIEADRRKRELAELMQRLTALQQEHAPRRREQARRLLDLRSRRLGMPAPWLETGSLTLLAERYGDARGAKGELGRLRERLSAGDWVKDDAVLTLRDRLTADVAHREKDYTSRQAYCATTARLVEDARGAYMAKLKATVRQYAKNLRALGELANVGVECPIPSLNDDDLLLAQAGLEVSFDFDRKGAVGLNDGEASGGQQVMKSLILLIALLMDDARPGGFVFIDEPFAHLDIANIDRVGSFLRATRAQYLITTPVTHNANVFAPAQLTLVTRKKRPSDEWAPPIGVLQRGA